MENFIELMRALAEEVGLAVDWEPVSPVELTVDGMVLVIALDRRGGVDAVVLHSELGEVPAEREIEVYRILLEANVMWSGTGDATLAVNSATRQALLCYRMALQDLDRPGLCRRGLGLRRAGPQRWRDFIAAADEEIATARVPRHVGAILA